MVGIDDELTAFAFNAALGYLLENHDNKREAERLKVQLKGIAAMLGAKIADDPAETGVYAEEW